MVIYTYNLYNYLMCGCSLISLYIEIVHISYSELVWIDVHKCTCMIYYAANKKYLFSLQHTHNLPVPPPQVTITASGSREEIKQFNAKIGDSISLNCSSSLPSSSPLKDFDIVTSSFWILPDGEVLQGSVLTLHSVSVEDSGVYTCEAYLHPRYSTRDLLNASDSRSATVRLNVTEGIDVMT